MNEKITIEIAAGDWMPGFGAYAAPNEGFATPARIRISIPLVMMALADSEIEKDQVWDFVMTTILHEVGHSMEHMLRLEFSEERVDDFAQRWQEIMKKGRMVPDGYRPCETCDGCGFEFPDGQEATANPCRTCGGMMLVKV